MRTVSGCTWAVLASCVGTLSSCASTHSSGASTLSSGPSTPALAAEESPGSARANRIAVYLGGRSVDEDEWEPVEDHGVFGFDYSYERPDSAVGFEIGLMASSDEDDFAGADVELGIGELYAGVKKSFGSERIRPYIGGGLSLVNAEVDVSGLGDDDDQSPALYVHGGVAFDVSSAFFLGLDVRFLFGSDLELGGVDTDVDYGQLALVLGFAL